MTTHKAKVIGALEVCGVAPGGTIPDLDDEEVNLQALISARLIELIPEPEPKKRRPPTGSED